MRIPTLLDLLIFTLLMSAASVLCAARTDSSGHPEVVSRSVEGRR